MTTIIYTAIVALVLAFALGFLLGWFKKIFAVPVDPKAEAIREALPGANCGGCGFPGCDGFASACAKGNAPANGCVAGGAEVAKKVAAVMGVAADATRKVALLACQGTCDKAVPKGDYNGVKKCAAAKAAINGTKMCNFGCIGFGDCAAVCKFDALSMGEDGLPKVDFEKCVGCGACSRACPQGLLRVIDAAQKGPVALCSNKSGITPMIMKNCKAGCIKCKKCERSCEKGAIKVDGVPQIDLTKCDSCGKCVEGCPTKVLALIQNIVQ